MGSLRCTVLPAALLLALAAGTLQAQTPDSRPPAHLAYVDGTAWLDREVDRDPATSGMPFLPGDRLSTEGGRVEVIFPNGSALDLDQYAIVEWQSDRLLRLTRGRIVLVVARTNGARDGAFAIETPVAAVESDGPGEYRISVLNGASGPETALAVVRGSAALVNDAGTIQLRAGERSVAAGGDLVPSQPEGFNAARADAFYQWAQSRRDDRFATASRDHLPDDLRPYAGDLERSGDWQYDESNGYVWYPNVAQDWEPYSDGYWSPLPAYGWTWVGVTPWAWPTHHYGRWGYARARWYWIPDRRWSPGWVSWGAATGYVSWCPLGFDNRPVFALKAPYAAAWKGWTVVPRDRFIAGHQVVRQYAVKQGTGPDRAAFITSAKAPVLPPRVATRQIIGSPRGDQRGASDRDAIDRRERTRSSSASPRFAPAQENSTPPERAQRNVPGIRERGVDRQAAPRTALPPTATALPPAATALPPARTAVRPAKTANPPTRTALPPARTALPPTATALPPAAAAVPPATTTTAPATMRYRVPPTEVRPGPGADERRGIDRPGYAPRESPERAAPPPRQAPRAEPPAGGRQPQPASPPAATGKAQARESRGEGKAATAGVPSRGDGAAKGKR